MKIEKKEVQGTHRQGTLRGVTVEKIKEVLGFAANFADDKDKVENSWKFTVDGKECGIWDYKGSHRYGQFSYYGPAEVFVALFGENARPE